MAALVDREGANLQHARLAGKSEAGQSQVEVRRHRNGQTVELDMAQVLDTAPEVRKGPISRRIPQLRDLDEPAADRLARGPGLQFHQTAQCRPSAGADRWTARDHR